MKTLNWISSKGNKIELRAYCKTTMQPREIDLDGHVFTGKPEPITDANLELWVNGQMVDSCWDTNFWRMIDLVDHPDYKKIWGLKIAVDLKQAEEIGAFLQSVIESGKSPEVKNYETAEADKNLADQVKRAENIVAAAESTIKNEDDTLMTYAQASAWRKIYNDINNEGGEGYVPEVVTKEDYEWAISILGM
jgi:hypothetical protein